MVPNLASYKTVSCQTFLILKGAVDKVTQFHHIYLYCTLNVLQLFYLMSGLNINVVKTRAIWIGSLSHSNRQLCKEYKLDWSQGSFKILGVTFMPNYLMYGM